MTNYSVDKVECCFDIVAVFGNNVADFGNNVERNFVISTKSNKLNKFNLFRYCGKDKISFYFVAKNGNNVEAAFVFDKKVECCFDKVESCFDIVASVDGAL